MTEKQPIWKSPTVSHVEQALLVLAERYEMDVSKELNKVFGVSERTLRRWKKHSDLAPQEPSAAPFAAVVAIWSLLEEEYVLGVIRDVRADIPKEYLASADHYQCPPSEFLKSLVGKKQKLGVTITELADRLKISHTQLGQDIKNEKVGYLTFCSLMMMCGFKPSEVFQVETRREYIYNVNNTIRTKETLEVYSQRTPEGKDIKVIYLDDVEYKQSQNLWKSQGYRWSVCEASVTEPEAIEWLMNNGLSSVPFLRGQD